MVAHLGPHQIDGIMDEYRFDPLKLRANKRPVPSQKPTTCDN